MCNTKIDKYEDTEYKNIRFCLFALRTSRHLKYISVARRSAVKSLVSQQA